MLCATLARSLILYASDTWGGSPGDPARLLNMPTSLPARQQVFNSLRGSITKPRPQQPPLPPLSTRFHPSSGLDVWVSPLLINHFVLGLLYHQRTPVTMQRGLLFEFSIRRFFKKESCILCKHNVQVSRLLKIIKLCYMVSVHYLSYLGGLGVGRGYRPKSRAWRLFLGVLGLKHHR